MPAPPLIDGINPKLWAVCPKPDGQTSRPELFQSHDAALAYKDEILFPATMDGALLPSPRAVRVPDEALDAHLQGITVSGPVCGIVICSGGRARVPVRLVERVDSCRHEWIVFEREDGNEWFAIDDDETGGGVGAYRKTDGPVSAISPHECPRGYQDAIRRCDQSSLEVVPIKWLSDFSGPKYGSQRFREYLSADELFAEPDFFSVDAAIDEIREGADVGFPEISCDLGHDWRFDDIRRRVTDRPAYSFKERRIAEPSRQLTLMAHALEEELLDLHAGLSAEAIAAFWTSWSVWNHFSKWSRTIALELNRRKASYYYDPVHIADSIQRQAWRFARIAQYWNPALAQSGPGRVRGEVRRSPKYVEIDEALLEIAKSQPKNHGEVFNALQGRVDIPDAKPFKNAGGWTSGFRKDPRVAREWLSKSWSRLELPAFRRGPK
jgi:hypothetical protein